MQLDPRPEPAPMTDAEIAKLIPPKGKESFVHWFFMHIDLEPDWRTAMPSCVPRFSELTDRQFADLYGESFQAKTARLENIDAGCGTASQLPQKASRGTHPPKRCFRGRFKRTQRRTVKAVDKTV